MGKLGAALEKAQAVLSEETLAERSSIKTGEIVDLSSGKRLSGRLSTFVNLSLKFE